MPASVVSVINYKGGVGKTTITANIGAELAARGERVLLVDLDPQASLTFSFYPVPEWERELAEERTMRQWFQRYLSDGSPEPLDRYVVAPPTVNAVVRGELHLLAAHLGLIEVDLDLAFRLGGSEFLTSSPAYVPVHRLLADALGGSAFDGYDVVLMDCAPNFGMVTRAAMVASDHLLIPARPDYLSTLGIAYLRRRLSDLAAEYEEVAGTPVTPEILGVVHTMVQIAGTGMLVAQRTSMEALSRIEIPFFRQTIRDNKTAVTQAGNQRLPVVLAADRSAAVESLRYELQQLTNEFVAKIRV
jgi:chromosome partitioning protein